MLDFSNDKLNNGGKLRTVFDVGCGVGGYLLSSDIIAMSLAPNDVHQNQIQFVLERGIPAYLGVLRTKRLLYPSRSFELAHCSRCRIDWLQRDGTLLLELDRLLRPGGYFAYSSPEAYAQDKEDLKIWKAMSTLVERMCWRIAVKRNQTVIWQKPLTNDFIWIENPGPSRLCVGRMMIRMWCRVCRWKHALRDIRSELWRRRVEPYWNILSPKISSDSVRNVMDMKANLWSFGAALNDKDVWVMNVIHEDGPETLKIVYDRGLIGTVHNWCEAFSTYPRTYDLLHAWNIFSDIEKKGCSGEDLLLEMDRILRPTQASLSFEISNQLSIL